MDDVRRMIYGTLVVFVIGVLLWIGFIYVSACGFTFTCRQGALLVVRTPIPTLIPATLPAAQSKEAPAATGECQVTAADLLGAWVSAGYPEKDAFEFQDGKGGICQGTFEADVRPLFIEANIWYPGSLSCVTCHSADVSVATAQLDLTGYQGILAGSRRTSAAAKGADILGGGDWSTSLLHQFLFLTRDMPPGHSSIPVDAEPVVYAGRLIAEAPTAIQVPPAEVVSATATP
jgi:hypothetical protein